MKKAVGEEWKALGEIQEANSAGRIDRLNALRFKMQSAKFNLSRPNSEKISEHEMPGIRKEIPKGETYNKYGAQLGKLKSIDWETWGLGGGTFLGNSGG